MACARRSTAQTKKWMSGCETSGVEKNWFYILTLFNGTIVHALFAVQRFLLYIARADREVWAASKSSAKSNKSDLFCWANKITITK